MRELIPACPPGASRSIITVCRPFRCAVNSSGQAGRASTDNRQIVKTGLGTRSQAQPSAPLRPERSQEVWCRPGRARRAGWPPPVPGPPKGAWFPDHWRKLDVDPLIRAHDCAPENPATRKTEATSECPAPGFPRNVGRIGSLPVIQQIVQLRIEVLRGRIPRLQEKIVDAGIVDGADGGVGIGIGGEQCPLGVGEDPHRFLQEFDAVHPRHALVGKQQGHAVVAHLQLLQEVERAFGESLPITRYSAPYCDRKSRSIARSTSESSSTLSNIGFAMKGLCTLEGLHKHLICLDTGNCVRSRDSLTGHLNPVGESRTNCTGRACSRERTRPRPTLGTLDGGTVNTMFLGSAYALVPSP